MTINGYKIFSFFIAQEALTISAVYNNRHLYLNKLCVRIIICKLNPQQATHMLLKVKKKHI